MVWGVRGAIAISNIPKTGQLPTQGSPSSAPCDGLLHSFLLPSVTRTPDAIAIDVPPGQGRPERQSLTYAQLDEAATRLARHLASRITERGDKAGEAIVALLIARNSPSLYVAQIAVMRAGAAFTCLDPSFPDDRLGEILEDAQPVAVLADGPGCDRLGGFALPFGLIMDAEALMRAEPPEAALPGVSPESLAYVIYTSGTTGKPKGVLVEHRNIANLVAGDIAEFGLGAGDRVVQGSSSAYDSSIEEIWLALASGACLVLMDDATARLGPDIIEWLRREGVTVFCPPPTLLRSSGCHDPARALPALRLLYVGGEALPQDLADLWSAGRRMVNGYGPTECAVTCLRGDVRVGEEIGIGRPIPGMFAWVLDEQLNEVADGARGELCIAGAGVARGYRHRPDLTAEKFVDHPLFGRLYRSGDLVHRDGAGDYFYHGRIDAQVKIRGHRVELSEIEQRLSALYGVRSAACTMQVKGASSTLVGFIVPENPDDVPGATALRNTLRATLPGYMVPVQIGVIDELPTTVGGKLDRARLPVLALTADGEMRDIVPPETEMERLIVDAAAYVLHRRGEISVEDDFFLDAAGDSLSAALLVTHLREDARTNWVTVSDIYDKRTPRALAAHAHALIEAGGQEPAELALPRVGRARPVLANIVQIGWLACELFAASWASWAMAFRVMPWVYGAVGPVGFVAVAPLLGMAGLLVYLPCSVALAVLVKRLLIGRYQPIRAAVWSGWYLRHWVVVQICRLIPWPLLQGSGLQQSILRLLGARIGRGVHIHRGVDLSRGGWDLLEIGDHVTLGQDVMVGLADLDRGDVVIGPIALGDGATLETRAGIGGWCRMGRGSQLAALSALNPGAEIPDGELWDGVPAHAVGLAPATPDITAGKAMSVWRWDICATLGEAGLGLAAALPAQGLAVAACWMAGLRSGDLWRWAIHPSFTTRVGALVMGLTFVSLPLTLVWSACMMRLMGPVRPGVYPRHSAAYLRAWLKAGMLNIAGEWLTGTIFWPRWLRLAGMRIGPKCEISTIIDVVPELVEIGEETFFADGIYLGGGHIQQGTVTLGLTRLGRNTFLGNHVVIPPGEQLPSDILIGIATRANAREIASGQSRFGHPSFDLPRRAVVDADRSLTHEPSLLRYSSRVFWEVARFALPLLPLVLTAVWWMMLIWAEGAMSPLAYDLVAIPLATLVPLMALCGAVLVMKWALIGRVRPGQHALWSCWCSRWDYVYVAWARYANRILRRMEGTFLLNWYLRAMGLTIGKRAVLGPQFAQVVDPDMIEIGDDATVCAMFQAHTFEDRVLKVDRVRIGRGATVSRGTVPLYGAVIDERTHVGPNSVIMKHEHLLPGLRYQGVPSRVLGDEFEH